MLSVALSQAFITKAREIPGLAMWANLLRVVSDDGVAAKELPRLARTSKRAMTTMLKAASRHGLVAVDGSMVRLTPAGRAASPVLPPAACAPLATLVSQLELEHPHHVISYGGSDPTMTGGPGVDWKPVPREPGSDVSPLPLTSLLSQAITAFAIEYESERIGPLVWAADVLRHIPDDGVAFVSTTGTHSMKNLERLGVLTVDASKQARLTVAGRAMRDGYEPLCARIEAHWCERHGSALIDEVIDAVRVDETDGLPQFPMVAFTGSAFEERSVVANWT